MKLIHTYYKKYITFFLAILLCIFALKYLYGKGLSYKDMVRIMLFDWDKFNELGYSRFYLEILLIHSLIYTILFSLFTDIYTRKENVYIIQRNKSIVAHVFYMVKHFIIHILLSLIFFVSSVSIFLYKLPFDILGFYLLKNTLAVLFICMLYYAITLATKDNLAILIMIVEGAILLDTLLGASFITMNIHYIINFRYCFVYIIGIFILFQWIVYYHKKKLI